MPLLLLIASASSIIGMVRLQGQTVTASTLILAAIFASVTTLLATQLSYPTLSLRYFVWAMLASAFWGMATSCIQFFRRETSDAWAVSEAAD